MGKRRKPKLVVSVGDCVIVGQPGITMPSDWLIAKVLWVDEDELLTEHRSSHLYRQVFTRYDVFAVGDRLDLERRKQESWKAVQDLQEKVRIFERELTLARKAVWNKLDELCSAQLVEQKAVVEHDAELLQIGTDAR